MLESVAFAREAQRVRRSVAGDPAAPSAASDPDTLHPRRTLIRWRAVPPTTLAPGGSAGMKQLAGEDAPQLPLKTWAAGSPSDMRQPKAINITGMPAGPATSPGAEHLMKCDRLQSRARTLLTVRLWLAGGQEAGYLSPLPPVPRCMSIGEAVEAPLSALSCPAMLETAPPAR